MENNRNEMYMFLAFNSSFIFLIPKVDHPSSLDVFQPISLSNAIYKVGEKIISLRIKPILSRSISSEQFSFLEGRKIHEAIGVA